ncbi:hypothetical protein NEOLEDRAFT_958179 [Neolentinus lepideus HHB14362 ss-1]|uniref:Uncharacterized protein n=1 Tax=Neolentinus lepideus HHB14362 ss-1 TaxID=1314782 RepID=A0A165UFZ2_9AGAM|nr:hypothetical protein NEOLEDRAFT_958179 [Neolentinus lepideus HHB14362 ss-1]
MKERQPCRLLRPLIHDTHYSFQPPSTFHCTFKMSGKFDNVVLQALAKEGIDPVKMLTLIGRVSTADGQSFSAIFPKDTKSNYTFDGTAETQFLSVSAAPFTAQLFYDSVDQLTGKRTFFVRKTERSIAVHLDNKVVMVIDGSADAAPNGSGEWV